MMIVLEGGDKTGKTTLAKALVKVYGLRYLHFGPPGPNAMKEYTEALQAIKQPTVCDRFFVGELVYGPMLRGTEPRRKDITSLLKLARQYEVNFILLNPDLEIVKKRFEASTEKEAVTWEQNVRAIQRFKYLFKHLSLGTTLKFNDNNDLLDAINYCGTLIKEK